MAKMAGLEDIDSDDYEEGEILDEDNIYENVSSNEEFSDSEQRTNKDLATTKTEKVDLNHSENTRKHRRKDHKCKDDSFCRKERKGKHCHARIRNIKNSSKTKVEIELSVQPIVEKLLQKKIEQSFVKYSKTRSQSPHKIRSSSPYKARQDHPKNSYRYDKKDYHEKENRHINKKLRTNSPLGKPKHSYYARGKPNKEQHYSKSRYRSRTPPLKNSSNESSIKSLSNKNDTFSKTSLLKRLVGSGSSGLKPSVDSSVENENNPVLLIDSSIPIQQQIEETVSEVERTTGVINSNVPVECEASQSIIEQPKKVEVKWLRSIKDDNDELQLRVEALRSAWSKKVLDRKKKGFIFRKKTEDVVDFLEQVALNDDDDDDDEYDDEIGEEIVTTKNETASSCFNSADFSGDILKPEDMVIVSDKTSNDSHIIFETNVTTQQNSSVFVDPTFFSHGHHFHQITDPCTIAINYSNSNILSNYSKKCIDSSEEIMRKKSTSKGIKRSQNEINSKSCNSVPSTDLDEEALRELALNSLKINNKSVNTSGKENTCINNNNNESCKLLVNNLLYKESNVNILTVGTTVDANKRKKLGDELDEDEETLRAQLLDSLTKQVKLEKSQESENNLVIEQEASTNYNILNLPEIPIKVTKPFTSKKLVVKKLDRRKERKELDKKDWRNQVNEMRKNRLETNFKTNKFSNTNIFKRSDNIPKVLQVKPMIINVNDDSDSSSNSSILESEERPSKPSDLFQNNFEDNVDRFLRDALDKQIEKGGINFSELTDQDDNVQQNKISKNIENTPLEVLKHLPEWQQEEYRMLKKRMEHRQKMLDDQKLKISQEYNASKPHLFSEKASRNLNEKTINSNDTTKSIILPEIIIQKPITSSVNDNKINSTDVKGKQLASIIPKTNKLVENTNAKNIEANIISCSIMEDITVLNDYVNEFERKNQDYEDLNRDLIRMKKEIMTIEAKLVTKREDLLNMSDKFKTKSQQISSKISTCLISNSTTKEENKLPREIEMAYLQHKEVFLKAHFLFHSFSNDKTQSNHQPIVNSTLQKGLKKNTDVIDVASKIKKIEKGSNTAVKNAIPVVPNEILEEVPLGGLNNRMERQTEDWDPNTPLCIYDLNGRCHDDECKDQHFFKRV